MRLRLMVPVSVGGMILIGLVGSGAILPLDDPSSAQPSVQSLQSAAASPSVLQTSTSEFRKFDEKYTQLAPALNGTDIDGELRADEYGNLIISLKVRDLFDYFLSAVGQASLEQTIAMIALFADDHLPPSAAAQAKQLLHDYVAYRQAAYELMELPVTVRTDDPASSYADVLEGGLSQLMQLRRKYLGEETATAFFGDEEAYARYTTASLRLYDNNNLSDQERLDRIEALRQQLPEALRQSDEEQMAYNTARDELKQAAAANLSDEALREKLESFYDNSTLNAVIEDQKNEREFKSRFISYVDERDTILASGLSETDQRQSIDTLRAHLFSEQEHLKVETYEAIEQRKRGG